jgi:hypothetical protein
VRRCTYCSRYAGTLRFVWIGDCGVSLTSIVFE